MYTMLDAAALATTSPLNLDEIQPSFTVVSFYKIFGLPDLGGLIVHKSAFDMLRKRRYFGGGTVDMVITVGDSFHAKKECLHESLEEGTPPFHTIIALDHMMNAHTKLYGSMKEVSTHTANLCRYAAHSLSMLYHVNGRPAILFYTEPDHVCRYGDPRTQGATIAMSVLRPDGVPVGYDEVEREANKNNIFIRSGAMCNPGGIATYLNWKAPELHAAFAAGHKCSNPLPDRGGKTTGVVRISMGACSTKSDIDRFVQFIQDTYIAVVWVPKEEEQFMTSALSSISDDGRSRSRVTFRSFLGDAADDPLPLPPKKSKWLPGQIFKIASRNASRNNISKEAMCMRPGVVEI
jgi:molybdenum cofactor sulfurtransferase